MSDIPRWRRWLVRLLPGGAVQLPADRSSTVDATGVDSKYIGETEKNLDAVFDKAERRGGALLFDESDALFGRRTDVKDTNDRYTRQRSRPDDDGDG